MVAARHLPGRDAAAPPGGQRRSTSSCTPPTTTSRARAPCASTPTSTGGCTVPALDIDVATGEPVTVAGASRGRAETPRLYDGELVTEGERVPLRIGFRTVVLEDGLIKVNGTAVLFKGVNRHEWHPEHGPRPRPGDHARGRAADEAAQHQRRAHLATTRRTRPSSTCATSTACGSSTSATWRPTASPSRTGGTTRSTTTAGPRPSWTARPAWSSATRTTRRSSSGRWATRPAPAAA